MKPTWSVGAPYLHATLPKMHVAPVFLENSPALTCEDRCEFRRTWSWLNSFLYGWGFSRGNQVGNTCVWAGRSLRCIGGLMSLGWFTSKLLPLETAIRLKIVSCEYPQSFFVFEFMETVTVNIGR